MFSAENMRGDCLRLQYSGPTPMARSGAVE
jgi:hypothetical protein